MNRNFKVGQTWTDARGRTLQVIIAITDNAETPVVTQQYDGAVWAYKADGTFPDDAEFSLVRLVFEPAQTAEWNETV